jgi:TetR/AcrR family transcriptional repressor of lmrAB and yxaGH operons
MSTKGERSKAKLVAATASLLQRQGYHATGLAQIVAESGAPRGSVYFYFPGGKEAMACAALVESGGAWRERLEAVIDAAPDFAAAIVDVCRELGAAMEATGWESGCPIATVALEASTSSPSVRDTCARHFADWERSIAARLERAGVPAAAAGELALVALSTIEGALLLAKVERSTRPLDVAGRTLSSMLRVLVPPR